MESETGIWRVGVLLEASYLPQLKKNPMKLIKLNPGRSTTAGVASICKIGSLNTYQYANDYISPRSTGCMLRVVDQSAYRYPSMLAVPLLGDSDVDCDSLLQHLGLTMKDLLIVTGLPQKSEPAILLASQHFMESYGFFTREQVWFRWYTPVPLQQVMVTRVSLPEVEVESIVAQLYLEDLLILQQGFNYAIPIQHHKEGDDVCVVQAAHCSPVLQGQVTKDTMITVLPSASRPDAYVSRKRRSFKVLRNTSNSQQESVKEEKPDCVIEAVCVPSYRLPCHYIVLPKETARKHNIFQCQNVWVEAHHPDNRRVTKLSDVALPLHTDSKVGQSAAKRQHMAVVFLYEVEYELEQYVPPYLLGSEYDTDAMTVAYLHPELLFFLFPETLSTSRRYSISIQRVKAALPKIKTFSVMAVASPDSRDSQGQSTDQESDQHYSALKDHFDGRSVFLSVDEVFKVISEYGYAHYYKVCSLGSADEVAGTLDAGSNSSIWECLVKPGKVHSYIPDIVPPSSLFPNPLLFDSISPAGLNEYAEKLFSFFLPAFRSMGSTKPLRCPSVLVHGPPGVGKHTVVQAVARQCRMHVVELNCHEFTSDTVAAAESRLMNSLDSATSCNPVVIILNNIHMLGRKNAIHEEPRICSLFEAYMSEVDKFNCTDLFPIIVVGLTSKHTEVPSRVQACFLQQLELQPPGQEQRLSMLKSLSKSYYLSPEVDLMKLAQATVGSVFGDLVSVFSQAYDLSVSSILQYCVDKSLSGEEDLDISGIVLTQQHLNTVLANLQSTQSDFIGAPKIPNVKWEDIGGLMEAKKEILDTIQLPLRYPHLFGGNLRRSGVLLYGAPGTGKTLLAKAVATECSLTFLSVKGPEVINMYVGQSEENIREVFARARLCAPCVIFFDELDSIAPNRGRSGDSGGVMDRVVSQLLAELDGLHKAKDVFIIGATNRPDLIDPALLRPGRFDRLVYLGVNEDQSAKEKILKAITRKFKLANNVDLSEVAKRCPSIMTGADLYALCSEAMMSALRRSIAASKGPGAVLTVEQSDFLAALKSIKPSITPQELEKYKNIQVTMAAS